MNAGSEGLTDGGSPRKPKKRPSLIDQVGVVLMKNVFHHDKKKKGKEPLTDAAVEAAEAEARRRAKQEAETAAEEERLRRLGEEREIEAVAAAERAQARASAVEAMESERERRISESSPTLGEARERRMSRDFAAAAMEEERARRVSTGSAERLAADFTGRTLETALLLADEMASVEMASGQPEEDGNVTAAVVVRGEELVAVAEADGSDGNKEMETWRMMLILALLAVALVAGVMLLVSLLTQRHVVITSQTADHEQPVKGHGIAGAAVLVKGVGHNLNAPPLRLVPLRLSLPGRQQLRQIPRLLQTFWRGVTRRGGEPGGKSAGGKSAGGKSAGGKSAGGKSAHGS